MQSCVCSSQRQSLASSACQGVARNRLLDLRQQQIVVAHNEIANALTLIGGGMKLGG
jgi:hypothetical protein